MANDELPDYSIPPGMKLPQSGEPRGDWSAPPDPLRDDTAGREFLRTHTGMPVNAPLQLNPEARRKIDAEISRVLTPPPGTSAARTE